MSRNFLGRLRRATRTQPLRTFPDAESLQAAWQKYRAAPDERLRNQLVEHYFFLVRYTAERVGAKLPDEVDVDDLISAGVFGLVDAIKAFDLDRGVKFETYCAPRIRGAILDELRSMDWVPRLVRHRTQKLDQVIRALETELGRMPTEDEISGRIDLPAAQFKKLMRNSTAITQVSLSQSLGDSETGREVTETDILADERSVDPVSEADKNDLREFIRTRLSRPEQLIIVLYYYEQMTMKEIGATLDLSESRVSQMHTAIIDRIRGELHADPVELLRGTDLVA